MSTGEGGRRRPSFFPHQWRWIRALKIQSRLTDMHKKDKMIHLFFPSFFFFFFHLSWNPVNTDQPHIDYNLGHSFSLSSFNFNSTNAISKRVEDGQSGEKILKKWLDKLVILSIKLIFLSSLVISFHGWAGKSRHAGEWK